LREQDRSKPTGKDDEGPSTYPFVRWLLALGVAIGAGVFYLHGVEAQVICHTAAARHASDVCGPPRLTDLAPFALVILVLLAPDFTELAIPGLMSLKRTVSRQGHRQDQVETKLAQVEQRVDNRINFTVHLNAAEDSVAIKERAFRGDWDDEDEEGAEGGTPPPPPGPPGSLGGGEETPGGERLAPDTERDAGAPEVRADRGAAGAARVHPPAGPPWWDKAGADVSGEEDDERASLTLQLQWLAKNLTQYEAIARLREVDPDERMAAMTEQQQQAADRWYAVFKEEIALVIRFRNALMHNPYAVSLDELREAVRIGRRLVRILLNGIGAETAALDDFPEP
jgi:hypothetical protein